MTALLADPPEITGLGMLEFYAANGLIQMMEPDTEELMQERALAELIGDEYDSPHSRPWHVSMHASQFPGTPESACARYFTYRMMNIPPRDPMPPWVTTTGTIGKAGELDIVDAWYRGGRMLSVPEDPQDAGTLAWMKATGRTREDISQLGFVDEGVWMTASTDLPILKKGWRKPYIVEVKCLGAETQVLTKSGKRCIYELANEGSATLVNGRGEWQDCEVSHFGQQRIWEIELERAGSSKTIMATGDHRWFVDKTGPDGKNVISTEILTCDLDPGQKLTYRMPYSKVKKGGDTRPSPFGVARGVVYGDGTLKTSGGGSTVDLFGEKDFQLLKFFARCKTSTLSNSGIRVCDLPSYFKSDLPKFDDGVSYLYGWLAGYFAADGTVSKNGSCYLDSADWSDISYVQDLCTWLGIGTRDIYTIEAGVQIMPNGSVRDHGIKYRICIQAFSLTESFFLIDEHRRRWLGRGPETPNKRKDRWTVVSVRDTGIEDDVYCAVVPGSESFVLDGFILTGNCKAHEVLEEMWHGVRLNDGTTRMRQPDPQHINQLKASIGLGHEHVWGEVEVCSGCWRIKYADVFEQLYGMRLNPTLFLANAEDNLRYCPWCGLEQLEPTTFDLDPPDCGEIYYWSRSWPRQTKSFFFMHDQAFLDRGRAVFARARMAFIMGNLPPREDHFQWSIGPCQFCTMKPSCRLDWGLSTSRKRKPDMPPVTKLADSHTIAHATSMRPHYDYEATRARVLEEWS